MAHGVTITLEMTLEPEALEPMRAAVRQGAREAATHKGFRGIRVVRHATEPRVLLIENWDSEADYRAYMAWRGSTSLKETVAQMLAAPPRLEIWPLLVLDA